MKVLLAVLSLAMIQSSLFADDMSRSSAFPQNTVNVHDVENGDVLTWLDGKWVNGVVTDSGVVALSTLSDVSISSLANGQLLVTDGANWHNSSNVALVGNMGIGTTTAPTLASLYVSGNMGVGTTAPGAKLAVGSAGNVGGFEADGTMYQSGLGTTYSDLPIYLNSAASNVAPSFVTYKGTARLPVMSDSSPNAKELPFAVDWTHAYKEGSNAEIHCHYVASANTACNFRWGVNYQWVNDSGAFASSPTNAVVTDANLTAAAGLNYVTIATPVGTGKVINSNMIGTIYRDSVDALDTCNGIDAYVVSCSIHIEQDTLGSRNLTTK